MDSDRRYEQLLARLRERGLRLTPQRMALLRLIAASEGHPGAHDLHCRLTEQFPTTSPATVYKTLRLLKDLGEIVEIEFGDGDNRYDGRNPAPHPHLLCVRCRRIVDPPVDVVDDVVPELEEATGYRIAGYRLDFYGLCPDCRGGARLIHERET